MKKKIKEFLYKVLDLNISMDINTALFYICLFRLYIDKSSKCYELDLFRVDYRSLFCLSYNGDYCDYIEETKDIIQYNHYLELQILFIKFILYKK